MKLLTLQNDIAFIGNDRNKKCTDTAKKKKQQKLNSIII